MTEEMKKRHHNLQVWQEGMSLVKDVYAATASFPKEEVFGLTSQMRRSAVSIPSNIAEGAARGGKKEFLQFLAISRGSLMELETQIILAKDLGCISDCQALLEKVNKIFALLNGLMTKLKKTVDGKR
jgi:four helix bundle protein